MRGAFIAISETRTGCRLGHRGTERRRFRILFSFLQERALPV
jgi:hypothetical protein